MYLEKAIKNTPSSRVEMEKLANGVLNEEGAMVRLFEFCFQNQSKYSCKALRVFELICLQQMDRVLPHLPVFISELDHFKKDCEQRPAAKICECMMLAHYDDKIAFRIPEKIDREKITETCFKWLLSDSKVAVKAYSMTCLAELGTEFKWIHPELIAILNKSPKAQSAGYKARARMILKQLFLFNPNLRKLER